MNKFVEKFYFFSKISSSVVLLAIIILLLFVFSKSYINQPQLPKEDLSESINKFSEDINLKLDETKSSFLDISNKIKKIESELNLLKENYNVSENEIFKNDIDKINKKFDSLLQSIDPSKQDIKNIRILTNKHFNTIFISIETGSEFKKIVKELSKLVNRSDLEPYFKKLMILSDGGILSYDNLISNFDKNSDIFLKKHLSEKYDNLILVNFLLKFFNLKLDSESQAENIKIKQLSIVRNYLYQKKIDDAIFEISEIKFESEIFTKWIEEAKKYDEAMRITNYIKNNIN